MSLRPLVAIVSITLLWQKMNTMIGGSIVITAAAAATPARAIPAALICCITVGMGFNASL